MRPGILSSVSILALAVATSLTLPATAQAGFEFVAPSGSPSSSAAQSVDNNQAPTAAAPIVPLAPVQSDNLPEPMTAPDQTMNSRSSIPIAQVNVPLTPVITDSDALAVDSHPFNEARSAPSTMAAPINQVIDNLAPTSHMPEPVSSGGNQGDVVQGFGRSVPLAIALQQIVPSSYRYSFEKPINPSMKISWSGGKPWKEIIGDVARSNNMNVDIASNVVSFSRQSPMDMIAESSNVDNSPDTVQGMKLKPLAGQHMASAAPVQDAVYDTPAAAMTTSTTTAETSSSTRKALASISDEPSSGAPTPIVPSATAPAFDGMMDNNNPANGSVKDKQILTADNKPVDILDKISVASPSPSHQSPPNVPKPVDSTPQSSRPLPAAMPTPIGAPTDITRQIDNSPVTANDLPAVGNNAAPPAPAAIQPSVDTTSKAGMTTVQEWDAHKGETLRQTLTEWSNQAGVSLVWSSEYDYPLQTDVRIQANYTDSVRTLLAGFSKAQPRPIGRLFKNDKVGAQAVLIVETQRLTQ
jgi:hypothetical protein